MASGEAPAMAGSANLVGVHPRAGPADQHVLALPPAYDLAQASSFVYPFGAPVLVLYSTYSGNRYV